LLDASYLAAENFQIEVAIKDDGGSTATATTLADMSLPVPPSVTLPPTNQTVTVGQAATFTASASGTPAPTVQWQVSTNGGNTFSNVRDATGTTLTVPNVSTSMNGDEYRAVFSNSSGTATSSAATLSVTTLPLSPGGGNLIDTVGMPYNQSISASGGSGMLSVSPTLESGSLPAGLSWTTSGGTLSIGGTPTAAGSAVFQVTATDSAGDPALTQTYTLTVDPVPPPPAPVPPPSPPAPAATPAPSAPSNSGSTTVNSGQVSYDALLLVFGLETGDYSLLSYGLSEYHASRPPSTGWESGATLQASGGRQAAEGPTSSAA
jgi:hypothetical protein